MVMSTSAESASLRNVPQNASSRRFLSFMRDGLIRGQRIVARIKITVIQRLLVPRYRGLFRYAPYLLDFTIFVDLNRNNTGISMKGKGKGEGKGKGKGKGKGRGGRLL